MLDLQHVADLDVSAASGLVVWRAALCVVADDETFLALYSHDGRALRRVPLFAERLAEQPVTRKRDKPDLEALCTLPDGRVLALGSGSTPRRTRAACVELATGDRVQLVELAPLYAELLRTLPELNIEGATVHGDALWLAQRGNGALAQNACIELELSRVLEALDTPRSGDTPRTLDARCLRQVHAVELGHLRGVPLGLTDLAAHPERGLLFSAAAEASASTYDDAACSGSVLGWLSSSGQVLACDEVSVPCKLEGVAVLSECAGALELRLVADPDDRGRCAPLFSATIK
jgi:hypothetical protein